VVEFRRSFKATKNFSSQTLSLGAAPLASAPLPMGKETVEEARRMIEKDGANGKSKSKAETRNKDPPIQYAKKGYH